MSLKTKVKVGNISNLSDARYCAGMGVEMLGFNVIEGKENFVNPKTYQEIRGWISGPSIVAEVYGIKSGTHLLSIIENYIPDFLELNFNEIPYLKNAPSMSLIISVDEKDFSQLKDLPDLVRDKITFLIVDESNFLNELIQDNILQFPVLVGLKGENTDTLALIETRGAKGIVLNGTAEIKPGLKDYDHLANIFEQLETD